MPKAKIEAVKREGAGNERRHIPNDYISVAAAVVEAARKLDEARRKQDEAHKVMMDFFKERFDAEKVLQEALENLKQASTGRAG